MMCRVPFSARSHRTALVVALFCLGACAGDGGSSSESGTALSSTITTEASTSTTENRAFVQWRDAVRATCLRFLPAQEALLAEMAEMGEIDGFEDVVVAVQTILPLVDEYTAALTASAVPPDWSREVERVYDLLEAQQLVLTSLIDVAAARDVNRTNAYLQTILSQGAELDRRLTTLGLPECRSDYRSTSPPPEADPIDPTATTASF